MDIKIYNKEFELVRIVDRYKSLIWNDKYDEAGDFELYVPANLDIISAVGIGFYVTNPKSEHAMIIESLLIENDEEDGDYLKISGRSLECLLERRIVWCKTVFEADDDGKRPYVYDSIATLIYENVIDPDIVARRIDKFIFKETADVDVLLPTFEDEYFGENLYEIVTKLCKEKGLGFKITFDKDFNFVFELYMGKQREYVVFSPSYDNLITSGYLESAKDLRNVTLIKGQGDDESSMIYVTEVNTYNVGIDRREIFTDASGVTFEEDMSVPRYHALLQQKGIDDLMKHSYVKTFEGEVIPNMVWKYGVDYFVGDIITLENEYGHRGLARVSEFITSCEGSGVNTYPTFTPINIGEYEYVEYLSDNSET